MEELEEDLKPADSDLNNDAVEEFYTTFHDAFDDARKKSPFGDFLFKELASGNKTIYNKSIRETKVFDNSFVSILEAAYPSFAKISKDPKKAIKYDQEVVQMEKARKFTADSIRHLSSHTQYIKDIKDDGMVVPSKVLTTFSDEELGIYENRFYKTLVNRIIRFLEERLEVMKENLESYQSDVVEYTNTFKTKGKTIELDCKVKLQNDLEDEMGTAKSVYDKVDRLCELFKSLRSSPFMQALRTTKDVVPPIMKTNIILHNPDFKILYSTWTFMESYNNLAFNVETKEQSYPDDVDVLSDIQNISTVLVADLMYHRGVDGADLSKRRRKTRRASTVKEIEHKEGEYQFTPDSVGVDNYSMSEMFLSETADFYNESLEDHERSGMNRDMSIRTVFREMLQMINNIVPRAFKAEYTELDTPTYKEQLEAEMYKAKVLKIVNEQKQIDLNKSIKEEEKALKKIITLEKKAKAEEERRQREEKQRLLREAREEKQRIAREKREAARKAREEEELRKLREEQARAQEEAERERERERALNEEEFNQEMGIEEEVREEVVDPNESDSFATSFGKYKEENTLSEEERKQMALENLKKYQERFSDSSDSILSKLDENEKAEAEKSFTDPDTFDSFTKLLSEKENEEAEALKKEKEALNKKREEAYTDPDKEDSFTKFIKKKPNEKK